MIGALAGRLYDARAEMLATRSPQHPVDYAGSGLRAHKLAKVAASLDGVADRISEESPSLEELAVWLRAL